MLTALNPDDLNLNQVNKSNLIQMFKIVSI